jgi:hypothetical protein
MPRTVLAVALGPWLVALAFAVSGVAAFATGQPLIWPAHDLTLSEAIGSRDAGEAIRLMEDGASPDIRYPTYDIFKQGQHIPLTPLEAAIATRRADLFNLLLTYGARIDAQSARPLTCFARQEGADTIAATLQERFGPQDACDGITLPW